MKNKVVKIVVVIFASIFLLINNKCQAVSDITEDLDFWKPDSVETSDSLNESVNIITSTIRIIGIIVSVGTLGTVGIKFILGSVEQKAEYKRTLIPWTTGAVLVFSITFFPTIIYDAMNAANKIEEIQISINKTNVTLKIGENIETDLQASVISTSERVVKWSSSNSQVATVDRNGKVTAKSEGTAIITAYTGKAKATCEVIVDIVRTTNITLSTNTLIFDETTSNEHQLTATIEPANSIQGITWESSDNSIVKVENGKVIVVKAGTATITAKSGSKSDICDVIVKEIKTTSITLSDSVVTLNPPKTYQLTTSIEPANSREPIIWKSSDNNIVKVENGKLTAVGGGTATITVMSGEKTATCTVQVNSSRIYAARYYNKSTKKVYNSRSSSEDLAFWVYIPDILDRKETEKLPLIVYLHGLGECGTDINMIYNTYPFRLANKNYPAVIITPQNPEKNEWVKQAEKIKGLIDYSIENYNVDKNKIALTGFSLGGSGVWRIGLKYPNLFSCLVPVSLYDTSSASKYPDCPVWVVGSTGDNTDINAETVGKHMRGAGKTVKVDIRQGVSHSNMPGNVYTSTVINWMLNRSRLTNNKYKF